MTRYRFDQIAENSIAKKKPEESDRDRYVGLEHLDPGTLEVTRWGAEVTPKGDKLLMKKGDVLFGRRRAYQKKVGIAPFDGIFSAHGMVLRPKVGVVDSTFSRSSLAPTYSLTRRFAFPLALFRRRQTGKISEPWNSICPH